MPAEHVLPADAIHDDRDKARAAVLTIGSGDFVHFDLPVSGAGQVDEGSRIEDVTWDSATIYSLGGPAHDVGMPCRSRCSSNRGVRPTETSEGASPCAS